MGAEVFILNPRYRGYPDSGTPHYHVLRFETVANVSNEAQWHALVPFLVVCCVLFLCLLTAPGLSHLMPTAGSPAFVIIIGLLVVAGMVAITFGGRGFRRAGLDRRQNQARYQRLLADSQILSGEVVSMVCREVATGRGTAFETTVQYQFVNPQGETRTGTQYASKRHQPVLPGTPVRVLYADDDAYVLL